jgi:predicted Zn finger-like uncharacterized protein
VKDDLTPTVLGEDQQYFVRCGRCNAAYSVTQDMIKPEGSRVKCEVCGHTWFQAANRLQVLGEGYILKVRLCPGHICCGKGCGTHRSWGWSVQSSCGNLSNDDRFNADDAGWTPSCCRTTPRT